MDAYAPEIEVAMKQLYERLNERDRRCYAGVEALKLGQGGRQYIARVLGCSRRTVSKGAKEVSGLSGREVEHRIRQPGAGRKSYWQRNPEIDARFLQVLQEHTAGSPMDEHVRWTDLTPKQIQQALHQDHGIQVSVWVVRRLLKKHDYRRRKAQKRQTMKQDIPHRDEQFENIARLTAQYQTDGNPVLSMDTKKKEHLGNFYREGRLYTRETLTTYDHDFTSQADGVLIPHSLYDETLNLGYIQLGTSHDTSEFACDSLRYWWTTYGSHQYPNATSLLLKCDGGGSNSARSYLFKQDLLALAQDLGIEVRIAHYPPYCSKFNCIEHRFFPHVTRACQGVVFTSVELVRQLMLKTHTQTGLKAHVHIIDKLYQTGRKVAEDCKHTLNILCDSLLPLWNYRARPIQHTNENVI